MTSECHALFQFPEKSIFRFSEKWKWFIKIDDVMYYVYKILIMSQKTSMTFLKKQVLTFLNKIYREKLSSMLLIYAIFLAQSRP